jgi:AcrR family transcriptional regulator
MRAIAIRQDIRDVILDAADRLLARYGYKKMTIDDLASEVGIGKGTIYLHFNSKEEVALARVDRIIDRLKQQLQGVAKSDDLPATRIRKMLVMRVLYRFDSVQLYTRSISELLAEIRPALLVRREAHFEEEARIFAKVLVEGRKGGSFSFKDPLGTAHSLLLATNSLLPYSLSVRELGERSEVEAKTARLADLLINGLRVKSTRD